MASSIGIPFVPNHWYYNTESGELTNGNNLENLGNNLLGGLGWHELNISGSATEAQAAAEAKKEFPEGTTPTTSIATGEKNAVQQETGVNLSGLAAIGDFFSRLTDASTWIRVGKVLVGGLLLIVGLVHITGVGGSAAEIARKVPVPV